MKKKTRLFFLFTVVFLLTSSFISVKLKPNDEDLFRWMEETYEIKCLYSNCDTFELLEEGKEPIIMQTIRGSYSPGIFVMEVNRTYRNLEDSSYKLDIHLRGFLGKFSIKEEAMDKIVKK